jgi:hypothetical protein
VGDNQTAGRATQRWSASDRLAVALACASAAMALTLSLIGKSPPTVGVIVICIAGFLVYPIIHFIPSRKFQIPALVLMIVSVSMFGWREWPRRAEVTHNLPGSGQPSTVAHENPPSVTQEPKPTSNPKPASNSRRAKTRPPENPVPPPPVTQACSGSNCIGNNYGSATQAIIVATPPLKLTWSAIRDEPAGDFPYRQTVTVKATAEFHPVSLAVICDEEIKKIQAYGVFNYSRFGIAKESNKIGYIYYENPPLAPGVPLVISVDSTKPFSVVDVKPIRLNF